MELGQRNSMFILFLVKVRPPHPDEIFCHGDNLGHFLVYRDLAFVSFIIKITDYSFNIWCMTSHPTPEQRERERESIILSVEPSLDCSTLLYPKMGVKLRCDHMLVRE